MNPYIGSNDYIFLGTLNRKGFLLSFRVFLLNVCLTSKFNQLRMFIQLYPTFSAMNGSLNPIGNYMGRIRHCVKVQASQACFQNHKFPISICFLGQFPPLRGASWLLPADLLKPLYGPGGSYSFVHSNRDWNFPLFHYFHYCAKRFLYHYLCELQSALSDMKK